jgi:hypothetical protein
MGLEYIRSAAGKPYAKRWARGLNRLKTPTLLDVNLSAESRVVTATLAPGCTPKPGDAYLVQTNGSGDLVVLDGHRQIARITNPPASITEALGACRGMAPAVVERISSFGNTAELKLG